MGHAVIGNEPCHCARYRLDCFPVTASFYSSYTTVTWQWLFTLSTVICQIFFGTSERHFFLATPLTYFNSSILCLNSVTIWSFQEYSLFLNVCLFFCCCCPHRNTYMESATTCIHLFLALCPSSFLLLAAMHFWPHRNIYTDHQKSGSPTQSWFIQQPTNFIS